MLHDLSAALRRASKPGVNETSRAYLVVFRRTSVTTRVQNGGAAHDAELHMVHVMANTTDELLVVGVLLDASSYGINSVVIVYYVLLSFKDLGR